MKKILAGLLVLLMLLGTASIGLGESIATHNTLEAKKLIALLEQYKGKLTIAILLWYPNSEIIGGAYRLPLGPFPSADGVAAIEDEIEKILAQSEGEYTVMASDGKNQEITFHLTDVSNFVMANSNGEIMQPNQSLAHANVTMMVDGSTGSMIQDKTYYEGGNMAVVVAP